MVVVLKNFGRSSAGQTATDRAAARLVQLLDVLDLFLGLHPAILEPDFDLTLGEAERVRDLNASFARQVAVELEFLLQLEGLVARIGLSTATTLRRIGTCRHKSHHTDGYQLERHLGPVNLTYAVRP